MCVVLMQSLARRAKTYHMSKIIYVYSFLTWHRAKLIATLFLILITHSLKLSYVSILKVMTVIMPCLMPDINVHVSKGFCHPVISNLPACSTTSSHVQIESMPLFATALQCSTSREYRERKKHSSQVIYFIFNTTNTDQ